MSDRDGMLLQATVRALRGQLREQMPASELRDYYEWGLDPAQPVHGAFLHALGVTQLVRMTASLLDGLVDDRQWSGLLPYAALMNVYQVCEVVSDDLAIGTFPLLGEAAGASPGDGGQAAGPPPGDSGRDSGLSSGDGAQETGQRALLRAFNSAMVLRLTGSATPAATLLAQLTEPARRFSSGDYSLSGAAHQCFSARFRATGGAPDSGIPDSLAPAGGGPAPSRWPMLVANVESALSIVDRLAGNPLATELRLGLVNRYRAVDRTLDDQYLPALERAAVGAQSILVAPTLAFYIGALAEVDGRAGVPAQRGAAARSHRAGQRLGEAARDGLLTEVLYGAALLVRLLNDLGPALLQRDPGARQDLMAMVCKEYETEPTRWKSAGQLLLDVAPPELCSRLHKDLRYREFNVGLYGLRAPAAVHQGLSALAADLDYFAHLYEVHTGRLRVGLERLTDRLDDARPGALVSRFVRFHERLYAHAYTLAEGDYANHGTR